MSARVWFDIDLRPVRRHGMASARTVSATEPAPSTLPGITVTATQLDEARGSIQPSLGATVRLQRTASSHRRAAGADQQVLLRAPGVAQDSFGQLHVRGDHGNLQYRLDGVQLPEGWRCSASAGDAVRARMSLITGALPAQYGFRTAGVVDIGSSRERRSRRRGSTWAAPATGGSRPAMAASGKFDYFVTGQSCTTASASRTRPSVADPRRHRPVDGLANITGIIDEQTRVSFIAGGSKARFQIPNNPDQAPGFAVAGRATSTAPCSTSASSRATTSASPRCRRPTEALDGSSRGSRAIPASPTSPIRSAT